MVGPHDRFLLLASDGVWDVMTDSDAQEHVLRRAHDACEDIAQSVLDLALSRGTRDNLSCLVVRLR